MDFAQQKTMRAKDKDKLGFVEMTANAKASLV